MDSIITILREDFLYIIKKSDVWLVFTRKSSKPWICITNGVVYGDNEITLYLANKGE